MFVILKSSYWFTLVILGLTAVSAAQFPYQTNWKKESLILGGGLVAQGSSMLLDRYSPPITPTDIARLNPYKTPGFDRFALRLYSEKAQKTSDILLISAFILPLTLYHDNDIRKAGGHTALILGETAILTGGLTNLIKSSVRRMRPYTYNSLVPLHLKLEPDARKSFFSGHTSITAALSFASAKIWSDAHPGHRANPYVWGVAAALPAATGYLRIRGGKHFLSDVLTGFVVGAAIGYFMPDWH